VSLKFLSIVLNLCLTGLQKRAGQKKRESSSGSSGGGMAGGGRMDLTRNPSCSAPSQFIDLGYN
jgi:hypothetical protein